MKLFTAVYFHQVNQYLYQPLHSHSTHDTIIQQIFDNSTQMRVYIMHNSDSTSELQQIIQDNNPMVFKNNIIYVSLSYNSDQSEQRDIIIEEKSNVKHQNLKHFNCHLNQNIKLLPTHKIIGHINQLTKHPIHYSGAECTNYPMKPNASSDVNEEKNINSVVHPVANFLTISSNSRKDIQFKYTNELPEKSIVKELCSGLVLNKDTAMIIINSAISNIQIFKKLTTSFDIQSNSSLSSIPAFQQPSDCQTIQIIPPVRAINNDLKQNVAISPITGSHNFVLLCNKKIHHISIFEHNYQLLFNHHVQRTDIFDSDDHQPVLNSDCLPLNQSTKSNNNLRNQQECNEDNLPEASDLVITTEGSKEDNFQIDIVACEQIIQLQRAQFDELLQFLLCRIKEDSICPLKDIKEPHTPNGIICIELSLLQREMEIKMDNKMIALINLLHNYFMYFTFVYSEDSHQMQQKIIKLFQNELQIGGLISINSDERVSKTYDWNIGKYACTFPNDKENWSGYFEINRNCMFCICHDVNKITVSVYEEQLEYQHLFEAFHKIYEDQLVLRIFDIQDRLFENAEKLLFDSNKFATCINNQNTASNNKIGEMFLLADNSERIFISLTSSGIEREINELTQYKKLFEMKMYSFFGINTPFCCLSYQNSYFNLAIEKSSKNSSSQLCLMTECSKEGTFFLQSFIVDYKNNKSSYYYYPSTLKEGPLLGLGSALIVAYLLGDTNFFGDEFRNVCFVKKCGYFELTKLMPSNSVLFYSNQNQNSSRNEENSVILIGNGKDTITVEDLCEYDKFELMVQVSKMDEPEQFAEDIWDQFIGTKYKEEFKSLQKEWAYKIRKITKILLKGNQSRIKSIQKHSSSSKKHPASQINAKSVSETSLSNLLSDRDSFFTREAKYIAEETDLGAGCFGVVSIAHLIKDPAQKFALKRLFDNKHILRDDGEINAGKDSIECNYKEEHDRELEALMKVKRIRSPFLVGYVGAQLLKNETKGTHKLELILELCNGDLSSYLKGLRRKKEKLTLLQCYDIFIQIVEGMRILHKNGIMHRDIKPQNILYKKTQIKGKEVIVWKIGDFGLASMKPSMKNTAGTFEYMAPEILDGEEYDKGVDVWSLGLVFHKILFGYSYYSKNSPKNDYKLSFEEFEKIDKETNDLLMEMIKRDKNKRITIEEIQKNLKNKNILVRKILNFDEDNEKEKLNSFDEELEEIKKVKEIDELWNNAHEWMELGCYNKAYNMLMNTLAIVKKSEKAEIKDCLCFVLNSIGMVTFNLGKYKESLQFYEESLSVKIKKFGYEHTETAVNYSNIGSALQSLDKKEEALTYYNNALLIQIKHYGGHHIETAGTYSNIGVALQSLGKYKDALKYFECVLSIFIEQYGLQHINAVFAYENIASGLTELGRYEEALTYYNCALSIETKENGEHQSYISNSWMGIGFIYEKLHKYNEAFQFYNRSLLGFARTYGQTHPYTKSLFRRSALCKLRTDNCRIF